MCPNFSNGICEVAGIEPEHVECAEGGFCYANNYEYEVCRLYMLQFMADSKKPVEVYA